MGLEFARPLWADFESKAGVIVGVAHDSTFREEGPGNLPDIARCRSGFVGFGKEFSEFKVNKTEAAEARAVGDIAGFGIVMAYTILPFKTGEEGVGLGARDIGRGLSAVGGNDVVLFRSVFQKSGNVGTAALFESLEDARLILTAFTLLVAPEVFVHLPLEVDADVGADTILEVLHVRPVKRQQGRRGR